MLKKNNNLGFKLFSKVIKLAGNIWFGGKVYRNEYIPINGPCILAGNHLSNYDSYMLYKGTKRTLYSIGKKELLEGKFGWFFKIMNVIGVDRNNKNPEAKKKAIEILNKGNVLVIFPEGTYHKKELLLPFKPGAISFAEKTKAPIIPFAIKGPWKFRSHPKIVFGKPIYIDKINAKDKVKYLEDIVRKMLIKLEKTSK